MPKRLFKFVALGEATRYSIRGTTPQKYIREKRRRKNKTFCRVGLYVYSEAKHVGLPLIPWHDICVILLVLYTCIAPLITSELLYSLPIFHVFSLSLGRPVTFASGDFWPFACIGVQMEQNIGQTLWKNKKKKCQPAPSYQNTSNPPLSA